MLPHRTSWSPEVFEILQPLETTLADARARFHKASLDKFGVEAEMLYESLSKDVRAHADNSAKVEEHVYSTLYGAAEGSSITANLLICVSLN